MITCNEKTFEITEPCTGYDLIKKFHLTDPSEALLLLVNGEMRDFFDTVAVGDKVEIVSFGDKRGKEVFWHSSAHVLAQAILRLFPNAKPTIGPAIDAGFYYDFADLQLSEEDFPKIEKEIEKILEENAKPVKTTFASKQEALSRFTENPYKKELITDLPEKSSITAYQQGEFFDLCRGPHLPYLGKIKAFKILKTSAAHWRGDQSREMLTRVYGISFPDRKLLKEYLHLIEEAKKRDHRVLGSKMQLFTFFDVAPGMPFILPNGMVLWNQLLAFWRELHHKASYIEIKTPALVDKKMWEQSGHWENYRQNMYVSEIDDRTYAIKPMNCPGCMLYFKSTTHSYRELPLRVAEIGYVHRHEHSGSLSGLLRVRCFHQDDAHIFMKPSDIKKEILDVLRLVDTIYKTFGLQYRIELSTKPVKHIGTDSDWEYTTKGLQDALDEWGAGYQINEGDGAFYGPKIDLHVQDALGRSWQCGTIQLDMSLPERFALEYTDSDGALKRPIMIHRALYGSVERFLAILIEHFAGKFPLWLNPQAIRILTVADRHIPYAQELEKEIAKTGIPCYLDSSQESVSKKVRTAQTEQASYMLTIGDRECENKTVTLRSRDNVLHGEMTLEAFLAKTIDEYTSRSLHSFF
ncbi:MAG: threonine--tRNA ligase [Verrucomicrobia bacterium]|nr:threonine--tRNA ligase [Verrucomicrobiota bacterium]